MQMYLQVAGSCYAWRSSSLLASLGRVRRANRVLPLGARFVFLISLCDLAVHRALVVNDSVLPLIESGPESADRLSIYLAP